MRGVFNTTLPTSVLQGLSVVVIHSGSSTGLENVVGLSYTSLTKRIHLFEVTGFGVYYLYLKNVTNNYSFKRLFLNCNYYTIML